VVDSSYVDIIKSIDSVINNNTLNSVDTFGHISFLNLIKAKTTEIESILIPVGALSLK
jgi:hypothetical protein